MDRLQTTDDRRQTHTWKIYIFPKKRIKSESLPQPAVTFGIPKYVYQLDIQSVKIWWKYNNSDMNSRQ